MRNWLVVLVVLMGTAAWGQNHWEVISRTSNIQAFDLDFVSPLVGWSCTYSLPYDLFKTTDGGYTWTGRNLGLRGVNLSFYNERCGFYADGNHAAVTFDGGETWTVYTQPAGIGVEGVAYLDSLTLIGTSNRIWSEDSTRRQIARSTDGGLTWTSLFSEICTYAFAVPSVSPSGTILIAGGEANEVWRSTDRGDSWQVIGTDVSTLFSVVAAADSGVFFLTVFGASAGPPAIARSMDDGFTWEVVWTGDSSLPRPFWLMDVQFSDSLHGWVCGDDGLMVQTSDGGDTWTSYYMPESAWGITTMSFLDSTLGWAVDPGVGSPTLVYRWSRANSVSNGWQTSSSARRVEILSIYPNPFNFATTIQLNVSQRARVVAEVYDILGRSVGVVTDRVMAPGIYQLNWKGSNHASGTYLVRVSASADAVVYPLRLVR